MTELTGQSFLETLATFFDSHREALVEAFANTLGAATEVGSSYIVEVDPVYLGLHCVSADEPLLGEFDDFPDSDAEAYELAGIDINGLAMDAIWDWLADCWAAAKGADVFPRAFANVHGYYDLYFDLASREWSAAIDVFPDDSAR